MQTARDEAALELGLECLASTGRLILCVTGLSMMPRVRPGSYVRIRRAEAAELAPGDIILARTSAGVRLHRLIAIEDRGAESLWITRGDNNEQPDLPLRAHEVLGVVTDIQRPALAQRFFRQLGFA